MSIKNEEEEERRFQRVGPRHPGHLLAWLNELRQEGRFCDVQLCCRNGRVAAHAAMLAMHSRLFPLLGALSVDSGLEIILPDTNVKQVVHALELIYCGRLDLRGCRSDVEAVRQLLEELGIATNQLITQDAASSRPARSKRTQPKKVLIVTHEHNLGSEIRMSTLEASRLAKRKKRKRVLMADLAESQLTCHVCSKVFTKLYRLKNHQLIHSDDFPFICSDCGKGFKNKYKLNSHEKKHEQNRPGKEIKSKADNSKQEPTKHERLQETGKQESVILPRVHICKHCGEQFPRARDLTLHNSQMHKNYHVCLNCSAKFPTKRNLATHLKVVHNDLEGILKHVCPVCGKRFVKPSHLEDHRARHNPVAQHACMYCPKRCATKQDLDRHLASHMGEARLTCQFCPRSFVHRSGFTEHVRKHLGHKPYMCKPCNKNFSQFKSLRHHHRSHEAKGDKTVLVIPNKASRGSLSYIDNIMSEVNLQLGDQKAKEVNPTAQVYIPGPHYIQSSQSITPLKQMQVITDFTEISRIGFHTPGVGGGLEGGDNLEPLGMLDNIYAPPKPDHQLGSLFDQESVLFHNTAQESRNIVFQPPSASTPTQADLLCNSGIVVDSSGLSSLVERDQGAVAGGGAPQDQ